MHYLNGIFGFFFFDQADFLKFTKFTKLNVFLNLLRVSTIK